MYQKKRSKNNFNFDFKSTNTDTITKLVNKINIKKATGVDQISCKLLKVGAPDNQKLSKDPSRQLPYNNSCPELISNLQGVSVVWSDMHGPF
jgi:hypothetical protein